VLVVILFVCCSKSQVVKLNDDNFDSTVMIGDWFILFDDTAIHKEEEKLWKELDAYIKQQGLKFKVGRVNCYKYLPNDTRTHAMIGRLH